MSDGVQREMTLDEWCAKLPKFHKANKELAILKEAASPQAASEAVVPLNDLLGCVGVVVKKAEGFEGLAGVMLANLVVNMERGTLLKPEAEAWMEEAVVGWRKMQKELKAL